MILWEIELNVDIYMTDVSNPSRVEQMYMTEGYGNLLIKPVKIFLNQSYFSVWNTTSSRLYSRYLILQLKYNLFFLFHFFSFSQTDIPSIYPTNILQQFWVIFTRALGNCYLSREVFRWLYISRFNPKSSMN